MKFHLIAATSLLFAVTSAHATLDRKHVNLTPPGGDGNGVDMLATCASGLTATISGASVSLEGRANFEIFKDEAGRPRMFTYTAEDGAQQSIPADEKLIDRPPAESDNVHRTARNEKFIRMRKAVVKSFQRTLASKCRQKLALSTPPGDHFLSQDHRSQFNEGSTPDPMGAADFDLYWFLNDGSGRFEAIDWMVDDLFNSELAFFADWAASQEKLPKCTVVITECQNTCTRVGTYGGGVACASLGGIAGFVLTPPIGLAAGAYCAGRVFVATEDCRFGCQVPVVRCEW